MLDSSIRLRPVLHTKTLFSQCNYFDKNPVGKANTVTDDGILELMIKPSSCHHYQDEAQTVTFICSANPLMSADETGSEKCVCSAVGLFLSEERISSRKKKKSQSILVNMQIAI